MSLKTGNTMYRHRANAVNLNISIQDELWLILYSKRTIDRRIIFNELRIQFRQIFKMLRQMPDIQRTADSGTKLSSDQRWFVTILGIPLLITEDSIIFISTLGVYFLIENFLFTEMRKLRPVKIITRFSVSLALLMNMVTLLV